MENQSKTKLNKVVSTLLIFLIILMQTIVVPVSKSNSDTNEYLKIYITNPNGTLNQGDTIYLTINAVKEITAIDAILSYDWDVFEQVTDASQCTILKSGWKILSGFGVDSSVSNQTYLPAQHEQTLDTGDLIQIPFTLKKTVSKVSISLIDMEVAYTLGGSPATPEDITATYEPSGYTIKYNKNTTDAVSGMPSTDGTKAQGSAYTIADEPTRAHYDCIGWATTNNATTATYRGGDQYTTDADLTLYALWKLKHPTLTVNPNGGTVDGNTATYTKEGDYNTTVNIPNPTKTPNGYVVKFDANGGTVDQLQTISTTSFSGWTGSGTSNLSGTTYTFGDNNQELKANYTQDAITLPTPTKTGSTFKGWYTATTGGTKLGNAGEQWTPTANNMTISAQWNEQTYTLTINPNGGTYGGTTDPTTVSQAYNTNYTVKTVTPPTGKTITFKDDDGTTTITTVTQTKNFDKWTLEPQNSQDIGKEGSLNSTQTTYTFGTANAQLTASYTDNQIELPDPGNKLGYTFDGWYTSRTGTNKVGNAGDIYNGTNTTLYAHWTANTYTVILDPTNGGTINGTSGTKTVTVAYGQTYDSSTGWPADSTVKKPGYDFDGWYNGNTKINGTDIVNITRNTTLTAKWLGAEIEITLDANGGKFSDETTSKTATVRNEGTYGTAVSTQPTRTGYTFKGWYMDPANDSTKIESSTTVNLTGPTTLKAKWETVKSTLTVNPNGGTWQGNTTTQTYTQDYNTTKEIPDPTVTSGIEVTFDAGTNGTVNGNGTVTLTKTFDKWTGSGTANLTPITSGGNTYKFTDTDTTLTATYKNVAVTLPTASKPGYTFKNWVDTNGNTITADNIYTNVTTPTTLTATYEGNSYNVNFNSDGGTSVQSIQVKNGEPYGTLPTSTKKGYTLDGWYDDNGNKIESTTTVNLTADQTLTAHWTIKQTTLTVDPDSGLWEGSTQPQQFKQDYESTKQITNDPVANSGFTVTFDTNGTTIKNNGATSFVQTRQFDHWELTSGDGTWNATSKTFTYGDTDSTLKAIYIDGETTLPEVDEKEGNDFKGWYKDDGTKAGDPGDKYTAKKNETLHAKFELKKYTVTYKNDDGTEFQTEIVEYGNTVTKAGTVPTSKTITPKTGYKVVFAGWNDESKLQKITSDVEVTATFTEKPIEYTITYENTKNVTNNENPKTYTIETPDENLVLKDLTNSGYFIFLGWFDGNGDNANKITSIDKTKLENITLYAHWKNDKLYLSSQKYKIGENDIDNYEDGDIYLDKIEPKTTVEQFKNNCDTNGEITVYDKDGNALGNDDLVGTGMTLKDVKDDQSITLTLIVMGDLNGDGKATIVDLTRLNMWLIGARAETEIQIKAADVSHNGKVTVTDLVKLNQSEELIAIPGREKLTYTKPNRR